MKEAFIDPQQAQEFFPYFNQQVDTVYAVMFSASISKIIPLSTMSDHEENEEIMKLFGNLINASPLEIQLHISINDLKLSDEKIHEIQVKVNELADNEQIKEAIEEEKSHISQELI